MAKLLFNAGFHNESGHVEVKIMLIHFQDENKTHFIYSPHLDTVGYGNTNNEAEESFREAMAELFAYTMKKGTLEKFLRKSGWKLTKNKSRLKNLEAPSIANVIKENDYVSDVFDKYNSSISHTNVSIPLYN